MVMKIRNCFRKTTASTLAVFLAFTLLSTGTALAAERVLVPMGRTVGIQMNTDGVLVVGLAEVETSKGCISPAKDAGMIPGDIIREISGATIQNAEDFMNAIANLSNSAISITIERNAVTETVSVTPACSKDGSYQLGLWLRDCITGIGTVTFYDPENGMYGALGHSISDVDTGVIMPLGDGTILDSTVVDVRRGEVGCPGELCGYFDAKNSKGDILMNTERGIFGFIYDGDGMDLEGNEALPVADESEIELGTATIYANICGKEVCEYEIEISRVYRNDTGEKSMMITITDDALIAQTGGIVQGMSGSPIMQNGKIIGAVTHVLVNDPTKGYGISIEKMLDITTSDEMKEVA